MTDTRRILAHFIKSHEIVFKRFIFTFLGEFNVTGFQWSFQI